MRLFRRPTELESTKHDRHAFAEMSSHAFGSGRAADRFPRRRASITRHSVIEERGASASRRRASTMAQLALGRVSASSRVRPLPSVASIPGKKKTGGAMYRVRPPISRPDPGSLPSHVDSHSHSLPQLDRQAGLGHLSPVIILFAAARMLDQTWIPAWSDASLRECETPFYFRSVGFLPRFCRQHPDSADDWRAW